MSDLNISTLNELLKILNGVHSTQEQHKRMSKPHLTSFDGRLQRDGGLGALYLHGEVAGQVQDAGQALALLRAEAGHAALCCREPVQPGGRLKIVSEDSEVSRLKSMSVVSNKY